MNLVAAGWFEENVKLGQYVRQALEDLDIAVDLAIPDRATSFKRIYTDYEFDIALSNNSGTVELVPEWTRFVTTDNIIKGAAFRNATGHSDPKLDALVEQLSTEVSPEKRADLARAFQANLAASLPWTALVEIQSTTIARADVKGHSLTADFLGDSWSTVWLDR